MERHSHPLHALGALCFALACSPATAQLVLDQTQPSTALVQHVLLGPSVRGSGVTFNGTPGSVSGAVGVGPSEIGKFNGTNTCLGLNEGIFLCTGVASHHLPGPNDRLMDSGGGMGSSLGIQTPDIDLCQLTGELLEYCRVSGGGNIYNKAILEFDFVPQNDMISFRYVFSSEEYERWACSRYNDAFGWFISGPGISGPFRNNAMNIAFIPGSMVPVCINAVNSGRLDVSNANGPDFTDIFGPCFAADSNWQANAQYYRYNGGQWTAPGLVSGPQLESPYNTDPYYIQHNGMTVVLTASAAVQIGETYHMKMGVANVGDSGYPSAVFIEQNSFRASDRFTLTVDDGSNVDHHGTEPVMHESSADSVYLRFNRWGGFYLDEFLKIAVGGDAIAGVDYQPALPDSIHFNQLDSAVVIPLALPVRNAEPRSLDISLITSNGNKVQAFPLTIAQELSVGTAPVRRNELSVFPNPAQHTLYVALPPGSGGQAQIEVLDMAGRIVLQRTVNGSTGASLDVSQLPTGLYTVRASAQGRVATTRVSVRP